MTETVGMGALWRQLPVVAMLVGGTIGLCGQARAQIVDTNRLSRPQVSQEPKVAKIAPPPALPGSKPGGEEAAPSDRPAAEMEPNEALFDAINRGDLAAAKDALSRGADLEARNVLGLAPLDLSVDLGHNDISFLLLSMRAGSTGRRPPASAVATQSPAASPPRSAGRAQAAHQTASVPAPPPPQRPQLFAGSGGTPVPQAGFLGFNTGRTP